MPFAAVTKGNAPSKHTMRSLIIPHSGVSNTFYPTVRSAITYQDLKGLVTVTLNPSRPWRCAQNQTSRSGKTLTMSYVLA